MQNTIRETTPMGDTEHICPECFTKVALEYHGILEVNNNHMTTISARCTDIGVTMNGSCKMCGEYLQMISTK